jgi:hypothetical protein
MSVFMSGVSNVGKLFSARREHRRVNYVVSGVSSIELIIFSLA